MTGIGIVSLTAVFWTVASTDATIGTAVDARLVSLEGYIIRVFVRAIVSLV